jgi:hypothetical protein
MTNELPGLAPVPAGKRGLSPLGLFIDRLLQTFEDRRPGLTEENLKLGDRACERFFLDIYDKERPRLRELVGGMEHLPEEARAALFNEVDRLIRTVVLPAYLRLTVRFTPRERNDFYLIREGLHALERVGWGVAGVVVGALVVWAPFIPLNAKEWILPFMMTGLFLPELRRYLSFRGYEKELNQLVARADREAGRIDVAYLLSGVQPGLVSAVEPMGQGEAPQLSDTNPNKTGVH